MDNIGLSDTVSNVWAIVSICCTIIGFIGGYRFAEIKFNSNNEDKRTLKIDINNTIKLRNLKWL